MTPRRKKAEPWREEPQASKQAQTSADGALAGGSSSVSVINFKRLTEV